MAEGKKVVGVISLSGDDALVYEDGSIEFLVSVEGANGNYFVSVPADIEAQLKPEDAQNAEFSELPGYQAPSQPSSPTGDPNNQVGGSTASQ